MDISKEQVSFHSKYSLGGVLSGEAGGSGLTWRTSLSTTICSINLHAEHIIIQ